MIFGIGDSFEKNHMVFVKDLGENLFILFVYSLFKVKLKQ